MASEYEKLHTDYRTLAKAAADGDTQAKKDKAKVMGEIRGIEREAAKAGRVLSAQWKGEKLTTQADQADSKRSLQDEYVRRFDDKNKVVLNGKETTLRQYHKERLLGR